MPQAHKSTYSTNSFYFAHHLYNKLLVELKDTLIIRPQSYKINGYFKLIYLQSMTKLIQTNHIQFKINYSKYNSVALRISLNC